MAATALAIVRAKWRQVVLLEANSGVLVCPIRPRGPKSSFGPRGLAVPVGLLGGLRRRCAIGNCSASFGYSADSGDAMTFETDPRDFAMELVEENRVTAEQS